MEERPAESTISFALARITPRDSGILDIAGEDLETPKDDKYTKASNEAQD